ncbi:MAG TPA: DUF362 domain-containing protein [Gemmatimonadaceae bacterium]
MTAPLDWRSDCVVAFAREAPTYPRTTPFDPSESYPELPALPRGREDNPAFRAVRESFRALGLDAGNFGSAAWNPLGGLVRPGDRVVLKPNLVSHRNMGARAYGETDTDSLVTHGSVVRAVLEYVAIALAGRGSVVIGDCPVQGTRWPELMELTGLEAVAASVHARHPGLEVRCEDFRLGRAAIVNERMVSREVDESRRDQYEEVDVGRHSALLPLMEGEYAFGVAQYPRHRMRRAHSPERNLYLFPKAFLDADVLINLPKLKGHMKAGVTCALKNFVGLNGHKDYLPHFRFGSPRHGGDEYPDGNWLADIMWGLVHADWEREAGLAKAGFFYAAGVVNRILRYVYGYPKGYMSLGGGSWHGNDTIWRMVLDINRAFLYFDGASRRVHEGAPARRYFAVIDGLVGGHRESPLAPSPYPAGVVLAGANPAALDLAATAFMGFDWRRIPQVVHAFDAHALPLTTFGPADVELRGLEGARRVEDIYGAGLHARFEPSMGYRGFIEFAGGAPSSPADASSRAAHDARSDALARLPEG